MWKHYPSLSYYNLSTAVSSAEDAIKFFNDCLRRFDAMQGCDLPLLDDALTMAEVHVSIALRISTFLNYPVSPIDNFWRRIHDIVDNLKIIKLKYRDIRLSNVPREMVYKDTLPF